MVISPLIAMDSDGDRASWARTACGRLCAAKLASAAPSAAVTSTVSMIVTSSRRVAFARRARKDPRIISALPGLASPALTCCL